MPHKISSFLYKNGFPVRRFNDQMFSIFNQDYSIDEEAALQAALALSLAENWRHSSPLLCCSSTGEKVWSTVMANLTHQTTDTVPAKFWKMTSLVSPGVAAHPLQCVTKQKRCVYIFLVSNGFDNPRTRWCLVWEQSSKDTDRMLTLQSMSTVWKWFVTAQLQITWRLPFGPPQQEVLPPWKIKHAADVLNLTSSSGLCSPVTSHQVLTAGTHCEYSDWCLQKKTSVFFSLQQPWCLCLVFFKQYAETSGFSCTYIGSAVRGLEERNKYQMLVLFLLSYFKKTQHSLNVQKDRISLL